MDFYAHLKRITFGVPLSKEGICTNAYENCMFYALKKLLCTLKDNKFWDASLKRCNIHENLRKQYYFMHK